MLYQNRLDLPHGGKSLKIIPYIYKLQLLMGRAEWMKGICHIWSRGRHFSPSLPGDRYLKLGSPQKRPPGRNLGEHRSVRRSGTASRGTVVLVLYLRMRSSLKLKFLPQSCEKIPLMVNKWNFRHCRSDHGFWLHGVWRPFKTSVWYSCLSRILAIEFIDMN